MFLFFIGTLHYQLIINRLKQIKMTLQETYLNDLVFNIKHWNKEVKSHRKEIEKFEKKLAEVSQRNNAVEVKQGIEQFQNRLIVEKEVIDTLSHNLRAKKKELLNADKTKEIDGSLKKSLSPIRDKVKTFTKLNKELQHEISDFFLEWL